MSKPTELTFRWFPETPNPVDVRTPTRERVVIGDTSFFRQGPRHWTTASGWPLVESFIDVAEWFHALHASD